VGLKDLRVIAEAAPNYPIQIQDVAPEVAFLMSNRHLWLRSRKQRRCCGCAPRSSVRSASSLTAADFICVDSPILTPAACEGTSTLFPVDYFDEKAF